VEGSLRFLRVPLLWRFCSANGNAKQKNEILSHIESFALLLLLPFSVVEVLLESNLIAALYGKSLHSSLSLRAKARQRVDEPSVCDFVASVCFAPTNSFFAAGATIAFKRRTELFSLHEVTGILLGSFDME